MNTLSLIEAIETDRLVIARLKDKDVLDFQKMTNHLSITDVVHFLPTPFSIESASSLIRGKGDGKDQFMGVWNKNDIHPAVLVATIGIHLHENNEIEIGYWVSPYFQRQGIAIEMVTNVARYLTHTFPKYKLIAECRPENTASWALLEKSGFIATEETGKRPGRYRFLYN